MTNPLKGETPLVLADGREFTLVLDFEALLGVETTLGKPLPQAMAMAAQGFMSAVAAIAQAAFARHHPEVTRADVLAILQTDGKALEAALAKASDAAFPKPAAAGNAPAPRPGGKTSGPSGAKRGSSRTTSGGQRRAASR
jgi:hypothetical protein